MALIGTKRILTREDLQKTFVGRIEAKNAIRKRNRERKEEFQKSLEKIIDFENMFCLRGYAFYKGLGLIYSGICLS